MMHTLQDFDQVIYFLHFTPQSNYDLPGAP